MIARCTNQKNSAYRHYGNRGIVVCAQWLGDFMAFYRDMGPRPSPQHTLERVDNDGPYSKENCVWATKIVQANNTRKNRPLEIDGRTMTLAQWARFVGISIGTIWKRLDLGWSERDAVLKPLRGAPSCE